MPLVDSCVRALRHGCDVRDVLLLTANACFRSDFFASSELVQQRRLALENNAKMLLDISKMLGSRFLLDRRPAHLRLGKYGARSRNHGPSTTPSEKCVVKRQTHMFNVRSKLLRQMPATTA